jgi:integration host factor subunit beta
MTKSELIRILTKRYPGIYLKDMQTIVETILDEISAALVQDVRVELRGFGAFSVRKRKPRKARNPRTNAHVDLEERRVTYFRSGKELRERVNKSA